MVLLGGLLGFAIIVIILLVSSKADFISAFNTETAKLFGIKNGYARHRSRTRRAKASAYTPPPFGVRRARSASRCCWCRC